MGGFFNAPSRCGGRRLLQFRWYGVPECKVGDDLETAVEALVACVSRPGRVWSPYALTMTRSEFRKRIQKAVEGKLAPVDEVKPVDVRNPPPLYEIRWQGVHVTEMNAGGAQSFATVAVRMYHSEPPSVPDHFVGHHVHEKRVDVADVNASQQVEIRKAVSIHDKGKRTMWGIV